MGVSTPFWVISKLWGRGDVRMLRVYGIGAFGSMIRDACIFAPAICMSGGGALGRGLLYFGSSYTCT